MDELYELVFAFKSTDRLNRIRVDCANVEDFDRVYGILLEYVEKVFEGEKKYIGLIKNAEYFVFRLSDTVVCFKHDPRVIQYGILIALECTNGVRVLNPIEYKALKDRNNGF